LDRVPRIDPFRPSTLERKYVRESPFLKLEHHTGARAFVRSGAVDHDLLVLGDAAGP
jgi:hypothetical protein